MRTFPTLVLGLTFLLLLAACVPFQSSDEDKVLTILYWQAPTLPGPYLAAGYKDRDAGAFTLEPLAKLQPGRRAWSRGWPPRSRRSRTAACPRIWCRLPGRSSEGLKWSDGSDVTAEDVVFTWRYCVDEATGCTAQSAFDRHRLRGGCR